MFTYEVLFTSCLVLFADFRPHSLTVFQRLKQPNKMAITSNKGMDFLEFEHCWGRSG